MHEDLLHFWFHDVQPRQWWAVDPAFDALIRQRFGATLHAAERGELHAWRHTPRGRLAEIIVLDQFSRNAYRGTARAFANDPMALVLAQEAVSGGHDQALDATQRAFLYMPYMHSESPIVHEEALRLFAAPGLEGNYDFELRHKAIIERFGRYPHRNAALGRESTVDEQAFLLQPGSHF